MTSEQRTFLASYLSLNPELQNEVHDFVASLRNKKPRSTGKKPNPESSFQIKFGSQNGLFLIDEEVTPSLEAYEQFVGSPTASGK